MLIPGIPANERERLKAVNDLNILDTLPEPEFDNITQLASEICDTPISLIGLIDAKRKWYKSKVGVETTDMPREYALCSHAILKPDEMLLIPDSRKDERFSDAPQVLNPPHVVFYAGVPLMNEDGLPLGTLCVIDHKPKELSPRQISSLKALANQVVKLLELRRRNIELEKTKSELTERYNELEKFAYVVAHDIKAPLSNIASMAEIVGRDHKELFEQISFPFIDHLSQSSGQLIRLVNGLLDYYRSDQHLKSSRENLDGTEVIASVIKLVDPQGQHTINYLDRTFPMHVNRVLLEQVMMNLISNAIRYNQSEQVVIDIELNSNDQYYCLKVSDNGIGIPEEKREVIFDLFTTLDLQGRKGEKGNGVGLTTVKKLVETQGGSISVNENPGGGSVFEVRIRYDF